MEDIPIPELQSFKKVIGYKRLKVILLFNNTAEYKKTLFTIFSSKSKSFFENTSAGYQAPIWINLAKKCGGGGGSILKHCQN